MQLRSIALAAITLAALVDVHAANLTASGYTQTFDSMGVSGTTPPPDWRVLDGESGTSNTTWTNAIVANGAAGSVASMVAAAGSLSATTSPTATNNNGYNAALNATATSDRVLASSPTSISGSALELTLVNTTGSSFDALSVSYDTVRFTAASAANELPGYQLFFSLGGNAWTNATALNPTLTRMPNTIGVTPLQGATVALGASVAVGQTVLLRWVDDNAAQTSPDQVIGLNNVTVSAVPEPEAVVLMLAGLVLIGGTAARRRS